MTHEEHLDGCELDFTRDPTTDADLEDLLVPEGGEQDEEDEEGEPLGSGSPDKGIATRLRRAGLEVREVRGWKTRGRDFAGVAPTFNPVGSVNHHTAGAPPAADRRAPSLGVIIAGHGGLPGPLANVYQDYDDVFYVVAAGVANHAGAPDGGAWRTMTGNSRAYGLEIEHPGGSRISAKRERLAARCHAALLWRPSGTNLRASRVGQHREWAPSRKLDLATNYGPARMGATDKAACDAFRNLVAGELRRLSTVESWTVSFLTVKRERVDPPQTTRDPEAWIANHPGAMQRGKVIFTPKRG